MAKLLLGRPVADQIYQEITATHANNPLKLVTVGLPNLEWQQYTSSLIKNGEKHGIMVENIVTDVQNAENATSQAEFFHFVQSVCARQDVQGVLLQQPLPKGIQNAKNALIPQKDVDCLSPFSVAKLFGGEDCVAPATPTAVINLLDFYGVDLVGKNVVIVGRSNAVGKPLALLMLKRNATVTVCHTKTVGLAEICRRADIIVSACGSPGLITEKFVTKRSIVVDVGLSFVNGKTCGDVAEEVQNIAAALSPVPGGVGPVTVATLFQNLSKLSNN